MASFPSHVLVAGAIGSCFPARSLPRRAWIAGAVCSVLPDADTIGYRLGLPYGHFFGHRGFSHSFAFALVTGLVVAELLVRLRPDGASRKVIAAYLVLCTASHGLLDAATNGGLGVALFSPFDTQRYFFPWRPLAVSPIGIQRFFSDWGLEVLRTELLWVWLPCALVAATCTSWRRVRRRLRR